MRPEPHDARGGSRRSLLRLAPFGAFAAAVAAYAPVTTPTAAAASTPPLVWRDISRVGVQCVVHPTTPALQEALCGRVSALARQGAPAPVEVLAIGEPSILQPGTTTLLVHAAVQPNPSGSGRLLAFTIRPFRVSDEQSTTLYGSAPRAVALASSGLTPAAEEALDAALSEILPWRTSGSDRPQAVEQH